MELAHSLLLNEEALKRIPESKRPVFVFEWLRFLDKVLAAAQKSDIKGSQKKLVEQLTNQISESPGPPTRKLLARSLAMLFSVGDTFDLFDTINKCNDIIKNKDDSPSYLPTRLSAVACLGAMYEKLGRMVGRSYEETIQILIKSLKNVESQGRCEIMLTLEKVVAGLGSAGSSCHKDIYKSARQAMTDRAMSVRFAATKCVIQLVNEAPFMCTTELETVTSLCYRALDGSNYDVRCEVAKLLGLLMACAQSPRPVPGKSKILKVEDVLGMLASGFLKGGLGFLKSSTAGEMIKGSASVNREIRVGVTHAYVEFVKCMGGLWFERNLNLFLSHVLDLVANPKATPSHVEAVYARKCISFVIRSVIGGMLGDKAQIAAAKEICQIIVKQMNAVGEAAVDTTDSKSQTSELSASQHVLVCALHELGCLVLRLGTSASPLVAEPATGIIESVISVLIHPGAAARLSAAWCLGSISVALPSQLTPLLDRCMERMEKLKSSPEAVSGYSSALAALLGGVHQCPLGIPHAKGKQIFSIAEELLRTASQNSRLSLQRTQSGWLLLGAFMTLGSSVVKNHLPRMLLLWKNAFPRSTKELESEKVRGDSFTWQVTLEGRAGALGAMHSFLSYCRELVTEDVIRRMLAPLECALLMLSHIPSVIKLYGNHLKSCAAMVRFRVYDVLTLLPPEAFEGSYTTLLRELVAEFTLTDNPANTTTSLLRAMCHVDDSVILGSWLQETDHKAIEDQLQPNSASGSGALEHDAQSLYARQPPGDPVPGPLPLGVAVIDSSVRLYGLIFPRVAHKHRYQMLQHFIDCIKQAKSSRQQAVQMNIFTSVLCALKNLSETKTILGPDDVKKAAFDLILGALDSSSPILRCAAGEALGRMAQVTNDSKFIAEMAQYSFDRLKSARDVVSRTGHSLALGCLHRYVGGMGSGQHLNTSVSIVLALAQDFNSPVVQVWAIHALSLIADSGGPMFRGYVEPTLSLVLQLLLSVPPSSVDVHQCLGKCLSALITSIGPELQGNSGSIATARLYALVCCAIMQDHSDSLVQAEAISCLQQLHMFAPRHVNLTTLVPHLCDTLTSSHLLLRRAAVSCLRQLVTREAQEVSDYALSLSGEGKDGKSSANITESGLEGTLFGMLDTEIDGKLISDVKDTLMSLLQSLAIKNLTRWLILLKDVLSATSETTTLESDETKEGDQDDEEEEEDAEEQFKATDTDISHPAVAPRWPTKVFAIECLQKIIKVCEEDHSQFDLQKAKNGKLKTGNSNFLVLHLSELVRMAFIAATSDSNQLRLIGLAALQDIIAKFSKIPEPEFPGHVILEQYQAQVGAALRPAFAKDTSSDVTAAACEVCSAWIGSGVARDLNDLRRVHQLLVSSLAKLKTGKSHQSFLYNESASTMEKLAVLRAWAEVYIVAVKREREKQKQVRSRKEDDDDFSNGGESLLTLVQSELASLSQHWFNALKDHALLSLPTDYSSQLPPEGGSFYHADTMESARPHYKKNWPSVLYALCLWLNDTGFKEVNKLCNGNYQPPANMNPEELNSDRLFLILGLCMENMCSPSSMLPQETVAMCLEGLNALFDSKWPRKQIGEDIILSKEILNVMHRVILTRESFAVHICAIKVMKQVLKSKQEYIELQYFKSKECDKSENEASEKDSNKDENSEKTYSLSDFSEGIDAKLKYGEGGDDGSIVPGKSVVFAALEVCLCALVKIIPDINPSAPSTGVQLPQQLSRLNDESCHIVSSVVNVMTDLPNLCSPVGAVSILPTILHLTTSILREVNLKSEEKNFPLITSSCLHTLKSLCLSPYSQLDLCRKQWIQMLQSALATVLEYAKPVDKKEELEESTLLLTLAIFIMSCPKEVIAVQSLLEQSLEHFKNAWDSKRNDVRVKCVQTLISIIQHAERDVSTPFIQALAPKMIDCLCKSKDAKPTNEIELNFILDLVKMLECLVAATDDKNRIIMIALLIPILVSFLLEEKMMASASKFVRTLHDYSLQKLLKIGPEYPEQFKQIMTQSADLKTKLESAIRLCHQDQTSRKSTKNPQAANKLVSQTKAPSIQLKTDFSFFTPAK